MTMAQDAVRTSLQNVRQLAVDLRPSVLADIGLVSALTSLATAHAEATGMAVRREINPVPDLGWAAQLVVYRVAQEALTNCAKHSGASGDPVSHPPGEPRPTGRNRQRQGPW